VPTSERVIALLLQSSAIDRFTVVALCRMAGVAHAPNEYNDMVFSYGRGFDTQVRLHDFALGEFDAAENKWTVTRDK